MDVAARQSPSCELSASAGDTRAMTRPLALLLALTAVGSPAAGGVVADRLHALGILAQGRQGALLVATRRSGCDATACDERLVVLETKDGGHSWRTRWEGPESASVTYVYRHGAAV